MQNCKDCGDPLGFGWACYRCKWVARGKTEETFEASLRQRAKDVEEINEWYRAHGYTKAEGKT